MKKLYLLLTLLCISIAGCSSSGSTVSTPTPTSSFPSTTLQPATIPTSTFALPATASELDQQGETIPLDPQATPAPASLADVTYCTLGGVPLKMDVYLSANPGHPLPAVVYIHGGGWAGGDKRSGPAAAETVFLTRAGFAVFSINYRLAPDFLFPAMIEDVKCAIRSIRAHAAEYNVDPEHIGVWGESAGGHLVSLLGTSDQSAGFDVGEYLEYSSRVQAVVDMFGPTDLTLPPITSEQLRLLTNAFPSNMYAAGSPVTYISPDDPPFLIIHGDKDTLVPVEESILFYNRLVAQHVPATLVIVKNAGHGFDPVNGEPEPGLPQIAETVLAFFLQNLQ